LIGVDEITRLEAAYRRGWDKAGSAPPGAGDETIEPEAQV